MNETQRKQAELLFQSIRGRPREEYAALLETACPDDSAVRAEVEALLKAYSQAADFMESPIAGINLGNGIVGAASSSDSLAVPADAIPGYRILKEIHRGGQGVVYQAIQESTRRKVALKVMLEGPFAGSTSKRRFEREIELVGSLRHPGIVPIYDSGVAEGQFYFAMEYVRGESLSEYVQSRKLSVEDTLRLMIKVCNAIDHAHQRGVTHRDLKPSNILVDERGDPRVVDFGLAKVGGSDIEAGQSQLVSITGQVMGTLAYMSPEQAAGRSDQVDIRSDVYSLGVIAYELLTSELPSDISGQMSDVLNAIQHVEPKRLRSIRRQIGGEVDTIVLKALAKERTRRYPTAGTLGIDMQRFLDGEPIEAKRDSAMYMLRKTLRRYRLAATAAALFIAIITAALFVSLTFWRQADVARQRSDDAAIIATAAKELAQQRAYDVNSLLIQTSWEQANITSFTDLLSAQIPLPSQTDRRGFEWYYWQNTLKRGHVDVPGKRLAVNSVAVSPDGKYLACGGGVANGSGEVLVWDLSNLKQPLGKRTFTHRVHDVVFGPDGKILAAASGENHMAGLVKAWDWATGRELSHRNFENVVNSVDFSPDGKYLAAGNIAYADKPGVFRVWDIQAKDTDVLTQTEKNKSFWCVSFCPKGDDDRIAVGSKNDELGLCQIEVWDLAAKEPLLLPVKAGNIYDVEFGPNGDRLVAAVGSRNHCTGRIWNISTRQELPIPLIGHSGRITTLCFNHDGSRIATGCFDNTAKIWDAESGEEVLTLAGHTNSVTGVAFSPDGKRLISGGSDSVIKIWDAQHGQQTRILDRPLETLPHAVYWGVAISSDGSLIAAGSGDGHVQVWDAESGAEILNFADHIGQAPSVAFSPNGKLLATGSGTGSFAGMPATLGDVKVWDLATQKKVHHFTGHTSQVVGVAFSPDGAHLASVSGGWGQKGELKVWDLASNQEVSISAIETSGITWGLAYSPDGTYLAWSILQAPKEAIDLLAMKRAYSEGRTKGIIRVLNLKDRSSFAIEPSKSQAISMAFSPDGKLLATGNADNAVQVLDLESRKVIWTLKGHTNRVHCVAFSPNGKRLASCGPDGNVKLWDLATGLEVLSVKNPHFVWGLAFSPDGQQIAIACGDGTVKILDGRVSL